MRFSTFLSLSILGSINIIRAQTQTVVPGARSLTVDECLGLVDTETAQEFGWEEDEENASKLWSEATAFEWEKALTAESIQSQKYPYLLCHVGVDETGKSLSGYQRRQGLAAALNYSSLDNTTYFRPLYNQDDVTCVYSHMLASKAASMTGDDLIVQPLLASLKYMMGTVDGMQEEMMFSNNADTKSNPSLDIILCPGAGVADVNAADANATDSLSWDVILEALKTDMVASLFTAEQSFFDANYVTTEAFFSDTSKQGVTARTLWWKQIIQNNVKTSCYCDDMYANRLKWTIQRTGNPDTTDSVLNVEVGTSGDVEHDTTCMWAHPNVCSLESRQRVRTHTVPVADWLTQSEVRDGTPFFDVSFGAIFAACLHDWKNSSMQLETPCYLHIGAECKHRFGARRERDVGRYDDGGELRQFPVDQSMRFDEPNQGAHWFANGIIENLFNYFILVFLFPFRFPL